jgi:hypothetical protein
MKKFATLGLVALCLALCAGLAATPARAGTLDDAVKAIVTEVVLSDDNAGPVDVLVGERACRVSMTAIKAGTVDLNSVGVGRGTAIAFLARNEIELCSAGFDLATAKPLPTADEAAALVRAFVGLTANSVVSDSQAKRLAAAFGSSGRAMLLAREMVGKAKTLSTIDVAMIAGEAISITSGPPLLIAQR